MSWLIGLLVVAALLWAVTRFHLAGEDLSRWDAPADPREPPHTEPSPEHYQAVEAIRAMQSEGGGAGGLGSKARLQALRERFDAMGEEGDFGATFTPVDAGGVPGEWVRAPDADPDRRVLYLHGGAYMLGSPKSHRAITSKFSKIAGAAVLAVDYRLMPEHKRLDGIEDCRTAYRWILEHGPEGRAPASALFVAGGFAGGIPQSVGLWTSWLTNRIPPKDPRVSPLRGDLAGLPPTLVHASEAEMLLDDARRWVNKAKAAGTDARLRTWPHQLHVWHIFEQTLPEAQEAFADIEAFLEACAPRQRLEAAPEAGSATA